MTALGLRNLDLKYQYRPNQGNIVDDFYVPCLQESTLYQRAVGYFTSGALALAARGLSHFIGAAEGKMQLIASPAMSAQDRNAIQFGYEARYDVVARCLLRELSASEDDIVKRRLGFLAWLIAQNRLEIKIAVVSDPERHGIYHEKIGIFTDRQGDSVAFSGSCNETEGGLYSNFESLEVFTSWRDGDAVRVQNKCHDFADLWDDETEHLEVIAFPDAARRGLLEYCRYYTPGMGDPESEKASNKAPWSTRSIKLPEELVLRDYQKEAVKAWFSNRGSGLLEMATGTGKTVTALTAAVKLYDNLARLGLFIVAPYKHLVDQWEREARKFGFKPILAYTSRDLWEDQVGSALTGFSMEATDHYCVITTTATFLTETMQALLTRVSGHAMVIADEAHHLGAGHFRRHLPDAMRYRLGLSATPERWYDDEGTRALNQYFAPGVVFTFGLKEAMEGGHLTRYQYFPHIVELTEEENEEYRAVSRQIAKVAAGLEKIDFDDPRLQNLLIARARIITKAENKLEVLRELVMSTKESRYNLFYCGDAKVEGERQVDRVVRMLGQQVGMKVHPFTSEETLEERVRLLAQFESGQLQGLVAIRCLDEGIDVPATQTAYILASSTNPREFIQRRGRILRRHPAKAMATIHDFIVSPRQIEQVRQLEPEVFNLERRLVRRELQRVLEFAGLADNGPQAGLALQGLKKAYNLLDM